MTTTKLAETILRDVPRYWQASNRSLQQATDGSWLKRTDVLAALTTAMDPAIAERAGEVLEALRSKTPNMTKGHAAMEAGADLITALLAQNAALRAEREAALQQPTTKETGK